MICALIIAVEITFLAINLSRYQDLTPFQDSSWESMRSPGKRWSLFIAVVESESWFNDAFCASEESARSILREGNRRKDAEEYAFIAQFWVKFLVHRSAERFVEMREEHSLKKTVFLEMFSRARKAWCTPRLFLAFKSSNLGDLFYVVSLMFLEGVLQWTRGGASIRAGRWLCFVLSCVFVPVERRRRLEAVCTLSTFIFRVQFLTERHSGVWSSWGSFAPALKCASLLAHWLPSFLSESHCSLR